MFTAWIGSVWNEVAPACSLLHRRPLYNVQRFSPAAGRSRSTKSGAAAKPRLHPAGKSSGAGGPWIPPQVERLAEEHPEGREDNLHESAAHRPAEREVVGPVRRRRGGPDRDRPESVGAPAGFEHAAQSQPAGFADGRRL